MPPVVSAAVPWSVLVLLLVDVMDGCSLPPLQEAEYDELRRDG